MAKSPVQPEPERPAPAKDKGKGKGLGEAHAKRARAPHHLAKARKRPKFAAPATAAVPGRFEPAIRYAIRVDRVTKVGGFRLLPRQTYTVSGEFAEAIKHAIRTAEVK